MPIIDLIGPLVCPHTIAGKTQPTQECTPCVRCVLTLNMLVRGLIQIPDLIIVHQCLLVISAMALEVDVSGWAQIMQAGPGGCLV